MTETVTMKIAHLNNSSLYEKVLSFSEVFITKVYFWLQNKQKTGNLDYFCKTFLVENQYVRKKSKSSFRA